METKALIEVVEKFHHNEIYKQISNMLTERVLGLADVGVEVP